MFQISDKRWSQIGLILKYITGFFLLNLLPLSNSPVTISWSRLSPEDINRRYDITYRNVLMYHHYEGVLYNNHNICLNDSLFRTSSYTFCCNCDGQTLAWHTPCTRRSARKSSVRAICGSGYGFRIFTCPTSNPRAWWAPTAKTCSYPSPPTGRCSSAGACKQSFTVGWTYKNSLSTTKLVLWIWKAVSTSLESHNIIRYPCHISN